MGKQEEFGKLADKRESLHSRLKVLEKQWNNLDDDIEAIERDIKDVEDTIREFKLKDEEEAFEMWKKQKGLNDMVTPEYVFKLTPEQVLKVRYLEELHASKDQGAIGGGTSYRFTPTSIGVVEKVIINGKEFDLTEYGNF